MYVHLQIHTDLNINNCVKHYFNCVSVHSNLYRPGLFDMAIPFSNAADFDIPAASSLCSTHLYIVLGALHL